MVWYQYGFVNIETIEEYLKEKQSVQLKLRENDHRIRNCKRSLAILRRKKLTPQIQLSLRALEGELTSCSLALHNLKLEFQRFVDRLVTQGDKACTAAKKLAAERAAKEAEQKLISRLLAEGKLVFSIVEMQPFFVSEIHRDSCGTEAYILEQRCLQLDGELYTLVFKGSKYEGSYRCIVARSEEELAQLFESISIERVCDDKFVQLQVGYPQFSQTVLQELALSTAS